MVKEKAKWWKTPPGSNIIGGLAVALILHIIKLAYDRYSITPILSTVGEWLNRCVPSDSAKVNHSNIQG